MQARRLRLLASLSKSGPEGTLKQRLIVVLSKLRVQNSRSNAGPAVDNLKLLCVRKLTSRIEYASSALLCESQRGLYICTCVSFPCALKRLASASVAV